MNKRQAKKRFKKIYGVNPNQFIKNLDSLPSLIQNAMDFIKNALENIGNVVKETTERIKTMSDEEYTEYRAMLEDGSAVYADAIRNSAKSTNVFQNLPR